MVMTLFLQPLSKLSASCLLSAVAIFVLETKAHAMNYNHFKELSRNKRGLVRGEEVRRRNLKLHCGRKKESNSSSEMKNCSEASEPLMLAGAEKAALATAGRAEVISERLLR